MDKFSSHAIASVAPYGYIFTLVCRVTYKNMEARSRRQRRIAETNALIESIRRKMKESEEKKQDEEIAVYAGIVVIVLAVIFVIYYQMLWLFFNLVDWRCVKVK